MEDSPSFERYLESELGWLRALAAQLVCDAAAADDLVQDTLVAALRSRPQVRSAGGARAWLTAVLRSQAAYSWRAARNRRTREERTARAEALPDTAELSAQAESQRALSEAVHSLSEPYRSVILLRYFHALTPAQIAAQRGIPPATARSQLSRAHELLRASLDRRHGGDSRGWCVALMPLVIERSSLVEGAGLSIAAYLGVLLMKHWLLVSVVAVLAAGLGVALRQGAPAQREGAASSAPVATAALEVQSESTPSEAARTASRATVSESETQPPPVPRPRLRGRVIESSTREPLEDYYVELPHETGPPERLITDANGEFESTLERTPGPLALRLRAELGRYGATLLNGSSLTRSEGIVREVQWNGVDALELEVQVQLHVPLRFAPPVGFDCDDFRAEMFDLDPDNSPLDSVLFSKLARVRGNPPYVRFESVRLLSEAQRRKLLCLVSDDGLWRGQAWFDTASLDHPVEIALERCAAVRFELLSATAQPLAQPSLEIRRLPDGRILRREADDLDGPAQNQAFVDGLAPGLYRFVARSVGMRDAAVELELDAGMELRHAFALEPLADAATIRGELRSRSGRFKERVTVALPPASGGEFRSSIVEWVERDGVWVAPFEFTGLRPGKHDVQFFVWDGSNRSWQPAGGEIEAPAEQLVFTCDDVSPLQTLEFEIVDDATGARLQNATVLAREGRRWLIAIDTSADATPSYSISQGMEVNWSVRRDGYEEQSGDNRSAVHVGGVWRQSVRLKPKR